MALRTFVFLGLWPFLGGVARSCHGLGEGMLTLATWALRLRMAQAVGGSLPVPLVQKGQHDLRAEMDAAAIRSEEKIYAASHLHPPL